MYTVAELIETLKKCPPDYEVALDREFDSLSIVAVAINHDTKEVILFSTPSAVDQFFTEER